MCIAFSRVIPHISIAAKISPGWGGTRPISINEKHTIRADAANTPRAIYHSFPSHNIIKIYAETSASVRGTCVKYARCGHAAQARLRRCEDAKRRSQTSRYLSGIPTRAGLMHRGIFSGTKFRENADYLSIILSTERRFFSFN